MASAYDVDEENGSGERRKVPSLENDVCSAKKFLQSHSSETGECLYDHLVELLDKILVERPRNAVDVFEDYSRKIKNERFRTKTNYLRDVHPTSPQYEDAKKFMKLYQALRNEGEEEADDGPEEAETNDDSKRTPPDIMELFFYLEQINVALPHNDIVALNLSIRKLMVDTPIENVRFWGKIIGKPKNYYIVEAELQPEELLARRSADAESVEKPEDVPDGNDDVPGNPENPENAENPENSENPENGENASRANDNEKSDESGVDKLRLIFPPLPKNLWKPSPVVAPEAVGFGVNAKVYYACNSPVIDDWTELPSVTPQQIVAARQIVRMCTGDPETPLHTFPPFPGTEKNYLRAQIARISAATLVSPIGYFTFGESVDEENEDEAATEIGGEEDEADGSGVISENPHYDPLPVKELIDPSLSNWCHHSPHILQQGRIVWWNPTKEASRATDNETDVEEEEDEEDEDANAEDDRENAGYNESDAAEFRKEMGPPLLTPLSEDSTLGSIPAWTARASSSIKSDLTAIAILRSNIWPGGFAFARDKKYGNVYIGTGQKFSPYNYSPPGMPMIQEQYNIGPELAEMDDPSFEAEEAYRIGRLPAGKSGPPELGGEEDEGTEDEDDEDVDDDDEED